MPLDIVLQAGKLPRPFGDFRFGETPWFTAKQIAEDAGITSEDVFVDLGCGRGKMVFMVHLLTGAKARGLELLPGYVRIARKISKTLKLENVTFQQRDFSQAEIEDATVVYIAGSVFEEDTRASILELVDQLPDNAQWMTVGWASHHEHLQLIEAREYLFSWGRETLHRYRVKR